MSGQIEQVDGQQWKHRDMPGLPVKIDGLWTRKTESGWRYAIKVDESHLNAQGAIHGGVLMTFMDHGLSLMIWEAAGRRNCATIQLDSRFLKAVKPPAFIELEAEISKQGSRLIFAEGRLRVGGELVMAANGIWTVAAATRPDA